MQEIASLFTDLSQLFIDMRYLNPSDVHFPPHEPPIGLTQPIHFGFTKDVVTLYQLIPFVTGYANWNHISDSGDFILGGLADQVRREGPGVAKEVDGVVWGDKRP